ncbi:MAG TPA: hypothetical protein VFM93_07430 [Candidatus Limnocylindria bacterium]|nr:hypothetical protein [Candidatus Limnocylindria bacterium]
MIAALTLAAACGGAVTSVATPSPSATAPPSPTRAPEITKPPELVGQPQLPLPTRMRFGVDRRADGTALLVLFFDCCALGLRIVDAAGGDLLRVAIAGSGIFGADSCVSRGRRENEVTTWVRIDGTTLAELLARPSSYRVVADGVPAGQVVLPLVDGGCRGTA